LAPQGPAFTSHGDIQAGHEPIDAGAVVELATTEACSYVLVVPQCLYGNLVSRLEPGLAESALLLQALIEVRSMDLTIFFFTELLPHMGP